MNFKNLTENLIITIVVGLLSGYIGYTASTKSNKQTVELLRPTIEEAIRKETTSISNEFKTEIKKLKNRDGSVEFDVEPILENQIKITKDSTQNSVKPKPEKSKKKKGFLGIFKKRNKD